MAPGVPYAVRTAGWQVPSFHVLELFEKRSRILVCVPVINEGQRIRRQLDKMRAVCAELDVVIADGGSTDDSLAEDVMRAKGVGSLLSPERFSGHEEILEGLARITSGVVIFSNPLVLDDCPESTREIAQNEPERAREYTPERFAEVASRFFTIESHGYLNKHRRLEVLRARPGSVSALAPSRRESGAGEGA